MTRRLSGIQKLLATNQAVMASLMYEGVSVNFGVIPLSWIFKYVIFNGTLLAQNGQI